MYGFNLLTYDTTETVQNNVKSITGRYVRLCTFVFTGSRNIAYLLPGRPFSQRVDCDPELQPYSGKD